MKVFIKSCVSKNTQIHVKYCFPIDIEPSESVKAVKEKIHKIINVAPDNQVLSLFGIEVLEDGKTISSYNIKENCDLYLMTLGTSSTIKVFAKSLTGRTVPVQIEPTSTVFVLKAMIEHVEGIPIDQQRLVFAGKQLQDDITLQNYHFQNGSVYHIILRLTGS